MEMLSEHTVTCSVTVMCQIVLFIKHNYSGRTGKIPQKELYRETQKDYSKCEFVAGPAAKHFCQQSCMTLWNGYSVDDDDEGEIGNRNS